MKPGTFTISVRGPSLGRDRGPPARQGRGQRRRPGGGGGRGRRGGGCGGQASWPRLQRWLEGLRPRRLTRAAGRRGRRCAALTRAAGHLYHDPCGQVPALEPDSDSESESKSVSVSGSMGCHPGGPAAPLSAAGIRGGGAGAGVGVGVGVGNGAGVGIGAGVHRLLCHRVCLLKPVAHREQIAGAGVELQCSSRCRCRILMKRGTRSND